METYSVYINRARLCLKSPLAGSVLSRVPHAPANVFLNPSLMTCLLHAITSNKSCLSLLLKMMNVVLTVGASCIGTHQCPRWCGDVGCSCCPSDVSGLHPKWQQLDQRSEKRQWRKRAAQQCSRPQMALHPSVSKSPWLW